MLPLLSDGPLHAGAAGTLLPDQPDLLAAAGAGELTKPQVLLGRFEEFFAQEGLNCRDIPAFNQEYQLRLGDTVVFRDDAGSLVARLKGRVRQYAVTNGTRVAQERKLSRSGLDRMLDGVFISEIVGTEKPGAAFLTRYSPRSAPAAGTR